jgi:hypothetical protein
LRSTVRSGEGYGVAGRARSVVAQLDQAAHDVGGGQLIATVTAGNVIGLRQRS